MGARPSEPLPASPTVDAVGERLHQVIDPEIGLDIVELGLVRDVTVEGDAVRVRFTVTTPACPLSSYIEQQIRSRLATLSSVRELTVELELDPPWRPEHMSDAARTALGWHG